MKLSRKIILSLSAAMALTANADTITFIGNAEKAVAVTPAKTTGLDQIYVLSSLNGVSMSFSDPGAGNAKWYRFSNLGGGYAEEITSGVTNTSLLSTLSDPQGDMGYIIEYGDSKRYYLWLVDYSKHNFKINGITPSATQECDATILDLNVNGEPIRYYTINGQQQILDQEIEIRYDNLQWDEESLIYQQIEEVKRIPSPTAETRISPPVYCNTKFYITGDRFLKEWGRAESRMSDVFEPVAVAAMTTAEQEEQEAPEEGSNIIHGDNSGLGGSAPAYITFCAYATDAVIHHEWQMSQDPEFEVIDYRFNQQDLDYTFNEEGVFYVRYVGSNADGSCETYGDTYDVRIGASDILCPNAFSPGTSPGVNDIWKVSYRSIVDFKCWIFNRYGTEIFHFTDPNDGWDGKYKGKFVKPGVYYYVIEALGADGKKYKLSGDINIIGFKSRRTEDAGGSEEGSEPETIE